MWTLELYSEWTGRESMDLEQEAKPSRSKIKEVAAEWIKGFEVDDESVEVQWFLTDEDGEDAGSGKIDLTIE